MRLPQILFLTVSKVHNTPKTILRSEKRCLVNPLWKPWRKLFLPRKHNRKVLGISPSGIMRLSASNLILIAIFLSIFFNQFHLNSFLFFTVTVVTLQSGDIDFREVEIRFRISYSSKYRRYLPTVLAITILLLWVYNWDSRYF